MLVSLLSAGWCWAQLTLRGSGAGDFTVSWLAARALLAGQNPYAAVQPLGDYPYNAPFFYPFPAALAALPFAWLPPEGAGALFFGLGAGLLAYALLRDGWQRLPPLFLSAPFLVSAVVAQWSPLVLGAALIPWAGGLLACKPNLGLALFAARPSWRALCGIALVGLLSLVIQPGWILDWQRAVGGPTFHLAPVLVAPLGWLLLLASLRLRDPRGRLLLAMALLPQSMWFYDQLPLLILPRSQSGRWLLTACSWLAYLGWKVQSRGQPPQTGAVNPALWIVLLLYLPALVVVLLPEDAVSFHGLTARLAAGWDNIQPKNRVK